MNITGIIPARYASTRFAGKPLAMLNSKPILQWVYEKAVLAFGDAYVATDDKRIFDAVQAFGGLVVMTSDKHQSGTDRLAEAAMHISQKKQEALDVIINIQGDEPFVKPEQLKQLADCFTRAEVKLATLAKEIDNAETLFNPNRPKVILDKDSNAIYFSRSPIPYVRGEEQAKWLAKHTFYSHIGLYGYRAATLMEITKLKPSPLELAESLEQNRWIEHGYKVKVAVTQFETLGIDTPEDLEKAREMVDRA